MKKSKLIQLVKAMQQGDEDAYNEIYNEFYLPMLHIALELTHNDADAKDAVQALFIQVHQSIGKLQEPSVFVLWMKRILANKCQNLYRARKNTTYNDDVVEAQLTLDSSHEDSTRKHQRFEEGRKALYQLVAQLDYIHQEVIVLYYFDQLKIKEIAKVLDISEGTVKSRLNTAKVTLRKLCKQYERNHHEKISLHVGGIGLSLVTMYAMKSYLKPYKRFKLQAHAMYSTLATPSILLSGVVLATIITVSSQNQSQSQKLHSLQDDVIKSTEVTNQEAYFTLRSWAHCKEEMIERDSASYQKIQPYFIQLQEHGGTYWKALQADGWAEDFINLSSMK